MAWRGIRILYFTHNNLFERSHNNINRACQGAQQIYDNTAWYPLCGLMIDQNTIHNEYWASIYSFSPFSPCALITLLFVWEICLTAVDNLHSEKNRVCLLIERQHKTKHINCDYSFIFIMFLYDRFFISSSRACYVRYMVQPQTPLQWCGHHSTRSWRV